MSREDQIRSFIAAREAGEGWCSTRGHTLLIGDEECYVCAAPLTARQLQVAAMARPNTFFDEIQFIAAGERFETPEGTMRAANGLCECGRRDSQHLKFYPWPSATRSQGGVPDCPGYRRREVGTAPGSTRIPRTQSPSYEVDERGQRAYGKPHRCVCGHLPADHTDIGGCLRCSCQHLTVR